ncbi:MAG: hypothetical protein L0Y44_11860 [Phycisphaerales bacterium]|nr:hypothetical protein [Phycisphaerales bacterium]MCI0675110.1 hypothetical protein [Phycisphaerales bacterium]
MVKIDPTIKVEPTVVANGSESAPEPTTEGTPHSKPVAKRRRRKLGTKNRMAAILDGSTDGVRRRGPKPYPVMTFEEAMILGQGIVQHGAGHPMQRSTLLAKLKLPNNQSTRNLITNSSRYAITQGAHDAKELKLTKAGQLAVDSAASVRQRTQARFDLAIKGVEPFNKLYEKFKGGKMPVPEVMRDALEELDVGDRPQCVDIFISNAKIVGILQTREGAAHLLTIEQLLEELPAGSSGLPHQAPIAHLTPNGEAADTTEVAYDQICFFMAPIDDENSEHRQHSDAILSSFVEPLLKEHGLKIIRADKIAKPGMISAQVIEYILKSKLVVVDMSFHDPNVFYELCLRHVTGKPTVHLIREGEDIPFDVNNFRTIFLPVRSVYPLLAKFETSKAEIAQQIRQVLADGVTTNNPILAYCPNARFVLNDK